MQVIPRVLFFCYFMSLSLLHFCHVRDDANSHVTLQSEYIREPIQAISIHRASKIIDDDPLRFTEILQICDKKCY